MLALRGMVRVVAVLGVAAVPACRCGESGGGGGGGGAADAVVDAAVGASVRADEANASTSASTSTSEEGELVGDAGTRFLEAGPKVESDLDAPPDPACTGAEISFAAAVVDARCAITAARAKKLRSLLERDGGAMGLRQEAKVVEEGRVALRLVNRGGTSLSMPLSFHGKVPVFSVLAEDERHTLYELVPPALDLQDPALGAHSHFARIVLPPGGAAVATIAISPVIAKVLGRGPTDPCKDGGAACASTRLAKGHYVLHVGELLTDVEAGAPARVGWDLP